MLIYTRHDPRFYDRRLHKGGDGGAGDMRRMEEERQKKVQQAIDAINGKFGVAPALAQDVGPAPSRDKFIIPITPGGWQHLDSSDAGQDVYVQPSGGGFDQAGYNAALADFQQRQKAAQQAAAAVGGAKTARDAMYADISGAVRDTAMRDLDRQYSQASRRNTFGLARAGLLGGSSDAEAGGELQELYGEGKLKATQAGQAAASELRSTDERTRQNLISLAQSGLDTGTAASMASGQMAAAADLARNQAAGTSIGRLFDDVSQAYATNQVMKARYPNGLPTQPTTGYRTNVFQPSRYTGTIQ